MHQDRASTNKFCKKFWWTNILYISNLYPCQVRDD